MRTPPHNKYSKRRNVPTIVNPFLSTVAHRCCNPRKVPLTNPSDSWLIFPSQRYSQAQPLGPASRNYPNGCQKHRESSESHNCPSGATKRRRWPPDPVYCSTQPPARAPMHPPRSPDSTRSISPMCSFSCTRRGLTTSASRGRDARNQFTTCKNCISSPSAGGACSPIRSSAPSRETPVPLSTHFYTSRSRYRTTNTCEHRQIDQRPPDGQESCRKCSAKHPYQPSNKHTISSTQNLQSSRPTTRSSHLGSRPSRLKHFGHTPRGK